MPGRITTIIEGVRVAWFRFGGVWFILCSAVGVLSGLFMLVTVFLGPASGRTSSLIESVALLLLCAIFMALDVLLVSVTAQDLRDAPTQFRAYWTAALARITSLRFELDHVLWDPVRRELAIIYTADIDGKSKRVSENLTFNEQGQVVAAEVFHGVSGSESGRHVAQQRVEGVTR